MKRKKEIYAQIVKIKSQSAIFDEFDKANSPSEFKMD